MDERPIGVFDSGLGGISVLNKCIEIMPNENFIYYADKKNAPYGDRTAEDITSLVEYVIENVFIKENVKAVVIACNTATNTSVDFLRSKYDVPIIGTEPAIKPALANNKNGNKTLVLATEATVKSKRFLHKLNAYKNDNYILMGCSGLVELIENNKTKEATEYLKNKFSDIKLDDVDSVVLGCTHYPFIKEQIKDAIGKEIEFYDGGIGVAKRLSTVLNENNMESLSKKIGYVSVNSSFGEDYNKKIQSYIRRKK